jgi:predicted nucleic acid-binding protein
VQIVVTDTNVIIDLLEVDALSEFFALPFEIYTTDFVMAEILDEAHKDLLDVFKRSKQLTILESSSEEIIAMNTMQVRPSLKRIADRSAFWKAKELRAMLLTGDRNLRKVAEANGLEVHGILWVVECLVRKTIISKKSATDLLSNLQEINPWLPRKEVEEMIEVLLR